MLKICTLPYQCKGAHFTRKEMFCMGGGDVEKFNFAFIQIESPEKFKNFLILKC